jgi:hypothetical protein
MDNDMKIGFTDNTKETDTKVKFDLRFFGGDPPVAPPASPATPETTLIDEPTPDGSDPPAAPPAGPGNPEKTLIDEEPPADPAADPVKDKKPDEVKPETAGAPDSYADFTFPEGVAIDTAIHDEFKGLAKEMNLSQEQAQKFIDLESKVIQTQIKGQTELFTQMKNGWKDETIKLPNYNVEKPFIGKAINQIAGPELGKEFRTLMNDSGLGNHPVINQFLILAGKAIAEDNFPDGKPNGAPKSDGEIFYPNMNKK